MPEDPPPSFGADAMPMRYAEGVLTPTEGGLHPVDQRFAADPEITRELLHNINRLEDGTLAVLYQLSGDVDRIQGIGETSPEVIDYQFSATGSTVTAYAHVEPSPLALQLLAVLQRHELIVDMPLEFTDDGGLRVLVIGGDDTIRAAVADLPDGLRVELEELGEYHPQSDRVFASLTDRQQETLLTALELGYYEIPREATHQDIADELDRTDATVGEHLRRIERTVFRAIAPR